MPDPAPDGFVEGWLARYTAGDGSAAEAVDGAFLGLALAPARRARSAWRC